jgi:hypothetical protein
MLARFDFTRVTNLEQALHDALLAFNGDMTDCLVGIAANADVAFKPCQVPLPTQMTLNEGHGVAELELPDFLSLLCRMKQIIDGHISIRRARTDNAIILDVRVVDSSFALVESDNEALLRALASRLTGGRWSAATAEK